MQRAGTLGEFLRFPGEHLLRALAAELGFDASPGLFKGWSARRLRVSDFEDDVALRGARQFRSGFRLYIEGSLHEIRRRADAGQAVILGEVVAGDDFEMVVGGGFLHAAGPSLGVNGVGFLLRSFALL